MLTRRGTTNGAAEQGGIVGRFRQTSAQGTHGGGEGNGVGSPFYDPDTAQCGAAGLVGRSVLECLREGQLKMTFVDNAFNNDESRIGRFLNSASHLMLPGLAAIAVAKALLYFGIEHDLLQFVLLAGNLVLFCGLVHNDLTRLCVRCMSEVPADAGHQAERQKRVLWLRHAARSPFRMLAFLALLIVPAVLIHVLELPRVLALPVDAFWCVFMYSVWLHHRLRPWCPYCREWGEGGGIHEPSPDPVVKATR
ncbi:hypothetical protein AB0F85_14060 [Nocardia fluminea]|uniref:hypothetical protein n=1 Tax=Nocardia fluminea TaxID=134984 RepID=UPI0033F2D1B8